MSLTASNLYPASAVGNIFTGTGNFSDQIRVYFDNNESDFLALLELAGQINKTYRLTSKCVSISLGYNPEILSIYYFCGDLSAIKALLPPTALINNKFYYILDAALAYNKFKNNRAKYILIDTCYGYCSFYYSQAGEFQAIAP